MYGFTEEQLEVFARFVANSTDEDFERVMNKADSRVNSYSRIEQLITDATHPSFRFGNTEIRKG